MARNLYPILTEMESHDAEFDDDRHVTKIEDVDMHFVANGPKF
jgi:hypothetical protein